MYHDIMIAKLCIILHTIEVVCLVDKSINSTKKYLKLAYLVHIVDPGILDDIPHKCLSLYHSMTNSVQDKGWNSSTHKTSAINTLKQNCHHMNWVGCTTELLFCTDI